MAEIAELLAIVLVIYLLDCAVVVPMRSFVLRYTPPARFRPARPFALRGDFARGVVFGTPWPPLGAIFVVTPAAARRPPSSQAVTQSAHALDSRFDAGAARDRLNSFFTRTRWLATSANALFLVTIVGLPLLFLTPIGRYWPFVVGAIAFLWGTTAVLLARSTSRLFAGQARPPFLRRLGAYLSPLSAMRARDIVARDIFLGFEPLTVAAVMLPASLLGPMARESIIDWRLGRREGPAGASCDGDVETAIRLIREAGVDVDALFRPPEPESPECRSFCPRCRVQYVVVSGKCGSCGDVPLSAFEPIGKEPL